MSRISFISSVGGYPLKANVLRVFMLMALSVSVFLLLVLIGFELLPIMVGNDDFVILQQANLQVTRAQLLAKDVLVLEYRSDLYHTQAVNELQTALPNFRASQAGLLTGDHSLGLPGNPPDSVRNSLNAARADYIAIVAAVDNILLHPNNNPPDPVQVNIVLQHERAYAIAMYQAATLLQSEAETKKIQLLAIKSILAAVVGLVVILHYVFFTRRLLQQVVGVEVEEEKRNQGEEG
jgi:hypothetical protein